MGQEDAATQLMEDRALVRRVLAGDPKAFDAFYEGYLPRLFRFALHRVNGNEADAEDAVQRCFMKALRGLAGYRGEAALFTWLCTICRREIHDLMHEKGVMNETVPVIEDDAEIRRALEMLNGAASLPEREAMADNVVRLVHATLDHLPPRHGDILERRYLRGESINDIAASMHLNRDAADSLLARARRAFRDGFSRVAASAGASLSDLVAD